MRRFCSSRASTTAKPLQGTPHEKSVVVEKQASKPTIKLIFRRAPKAEIDLHCEPISMLLASSLVTCATQQEPM